MNLTNEPGISSCIHSGAKDASAQSFSSQVGPPPASTAYDTFCLGVGVGSTQVASPGSWSAFHSTEERIHDSIQDYVASSSLKTNT